MPKVQQSSGHGHGGSRRRGPRVSSSLAEINVVPLVDVMLVLLMNLPRAVNAKNVSAKPIYVTVPATFQKDRRVQIGDDNIPVSILEERVKQALLETSDKSLFVRGDGDVAWKDIIYVFDRLKAAGIEKVGVVTQPVGSK